MPSKKYNARFPPTRIKKIMQTDEDVGKVAAAVPVIISRALELFAESLITKASQATQAKNAKTMTTAHLKRCILDETQFDFLKDLVQECPDDVEHETINNGSSELKTKKRRKTQEEARNSKLRKQASSNSHEKSVTENSSDSDGSCVDSVDNTVDSEHSGHSLSGCSDTPHINNKLHQTGESSSTTTYLTNTDNSRDLSHDSSTPNNRTQQSVIVGCQPTIPNRSSQSGNDREIMLQLQSSTPISYQSPGTSTTTYQYQHDDITDDDYDS